MNRRNAMSDAAKEARRQYKRAWNQKNRDKVKAAQVRYWERKAAELGADQRQPAEE